MPLDDRGDIVTLCEVADYLKVAEKTVHKIIHRGQIHCADSEVVHLHVIGRITKLLYRQVVVQSLISAGDKTDVIKSILKGESEAVKGLVQ